ncbi:MAG: sterol desaturase family protein, partial [Bryobacteraceae bacterium]
NRNFGQFFPWWDRLLRTYAAAPARGTKNLKIGIKELRGVDTISASYTLIEPFHGPRAGSPQAPVAQA